MFLNYVFIDPIPNYKIEFDLLPVTTRFDLYPWGQASCRLICHPVSDLHSHSPKVSYHTRPFKGPFTMLWYLNLTGTFSVAHAIRPVLYRGSEFLEKWQAEITHSETFPWTLNSNVCMAVDTKSNLIYHCIIRTSGLKYFTTYVSIPI